MSTFAVTFLCAATFISMASLLLAEISTLLSLCILKGKEYG